MCARLAEGKGEADRPAAAPEDDGSAVQVWARRRRGCVQTGGDQERQFKILGSGKVVFIWTQSNFCIDFINH